jgi:hypothetical protein
MATRICALLRVLYCNCRWPSWHASIPFAGRHLIYVTVFQVFPASFTWLVFQNASHNRPFYGRTIFLSDCVNQSSVGKCSIGSSRYDGEVGVVGCVLVWLGGHLHSECRRLEIYVPIVPFTRTSWLGVV